MHKDWFIVRVINPTTHDQGVMMVKAIGAATAHSAAAALYRQRRGLKTGVHVHTLTLDRNANRVGVAS